MAYSDVFSRLVRNDNDVAGRVAYGIYKTTKQEFIKKEQSERGTVLIPDDVMEEFYASQTDYMLELYRKHANKLLREFLDESYKDDIAKEKQSLEEKYEKLSDSVKPSFWHGVLQSITASFLFLLAGYILLKMNGSWDILLGNLLK